jgi:hypothetical protein
MYITTKRAKNTKSIFKLAFTLRVLRALRGEYLFAFTAGLKSARAVMKKTDSVYTIALILSQV